MNRHLCVFFLFLPPEQVATWHFPRNDRVKFSPDRPWLGRSFFLGHRAVSVAPHGSMCGGVVPLIFPLRRRAQFEQPKGKLYASRHGRMDRCIQAAFFSPSLRSPRCSFFVSFVGRPSSSSRLESRGILGWISSRFVDSRLEDLLLWGNEKRQQDYPVSERSIRSKSQHKYKIEVSRSRRIHG